MKARLAFIPLFICLIFGGLFAFADEVAELKAKAEKGDAAAQTLLGYHYVRGEDVVQDYSEAIKWWRKRDDT